ncbi:alpha/beta hydrolase fold domain-containing protein [Salinicola halophilus]|uniref:alpha/beta hydrolase fold domain-containing protein n=1 Tax=Salinicola halophilus TaxID=184065 RepID=UPI000DA17591|nr:alpha/beta hydrolase fold domain-containing protein [Salinicola halophilus]
MPIESFIRRLSTLDASAAAPLAERRRLYDALHRTHRPPDPPGLRVEAERLAGVEVRRFVFADGDGAPVVYLHGGGWNLGSTQSHHGITADLAARLAREVISVDYRRLPEASYAEALADCRAVVNAASPAALIGDSAGGRLAHDVAHLDAFSSVLGLIYPVLGTPTPETLGPDGPLLSRADVLALWEMAAPTVPAIDPAVPPAPAIEALAVERDPLTRPLEQAVTQWRAAGASVGYRCAPDMVHSALHGHAELDAMHHAWGAFCAAIGERIANDAASSPGSVAHAASVGTPR